MKLITDGFLNHISMLKPENNYITFFFYYYIGNSKF